MRPADDSTSSAPPTRFQRWVKRAWWLHSVWALAFGVGVMIVARQGLQFADKILIVLGLSWLLMFIALRFIVGPSNRSADERFTRKGVRMLTNYVVKNLYQQMFFFLVPLYASSATWSFASWNWWLAPVLLACGILSTMDLVFDNFIMERRWIASTMYGFAMFGVLNLILPLVFGMEHLLSLLIAAAATAPAVALLNFRLRQVVSANGLIAIILSGGALMAVAWFGRTLVPPAPMSLVSAAVGHGSPGSYECLPGAKSSMRADRLEQLRCGSVVTEPGGLRDEIVHVWRHRGAVVYRGEKLPSIEGCRDVRVSRVPAEALPADPTGGWQCRIETADGQLVGLVRFQVVAAPEALPADPPPAEPPPAEPPPPVVPDARPPADAAPPPADAAP